ncbi:hypothetical protein BW425_25340 [Bacillus pseudomycoides]|uniref:Uncharacterized protein n=1 Tax=Bacillus pseudomycoides TaxID=64104 RepID=A0A1Y3MEY6_9BACI|nr:RapH N-terminal domain-containing protein [Bacillus pseudomycoides]OUM46162.1 hypothetical protein BW425_25340 [Bacillus pseudomycoides]PEM70954.1 hypothetical protein CN619_19225 [Bacillus pseudomycoides]
MNVQLKSGEKHTELLYEWYAVIRTRNIDKAIHLKEEVDKHIHEFQHFPDLLLHYSLVDFRYNYLVDNLGISKNDFDIIDSFVIPTTGILAYYYHFFKAIYYNATGNYILGKDYFYKAENLLQYCSDKLEYAEFHYMLGYSLYENFQSLLALKEISIAKEIFSQHDNCEVNIAFCNNLSGLFCTHLQEFEMAEEYYTSALNTFQKIEEETFILMVRQNLAFMYSEQNLSTLSLRYLSEVNQKMLNNYKALFIEARERFKIKEIDVASERIERGIHICKGLQNEEYLHHFYILQAFVNNIPALEIEKLVQAGNTYFEKENLLEYTQKYHEQLAHKYYQEKNYLKASEYFYLASNLKEKLKEKLFDKEGQK